MKERVATIAKAMINYVPAEVPPNTYFSIAFMAKKNSGKLYASSGSTLHIIQQSLFTVQPNKLIGFNFVNPILTPKELQQLLKL